MVSMTSRSSPAAGPGESAISDQMLTRLSHLERADLLRRVQMLHASEFSISQRVLTARRCGTAYGCRLARLKTGGNVEVTSKVPWLCGRRFATPTVTTGTRWAITTDSGHGR